MSQQKCSRCFGCVGKQWCCNTLNVHLELFHPGTLLLGVGSEVRACGHRETLEASLGPPHSGNRMGVPSGPRPQVLLPGPDRLPCPHTYGWLSPAAQNLYFHPFRTSLGFTPVLWGLPELISSSSSSTCQRPKHSRVQQHRLPSLYPPGPRLCPDWGCLPSRVPLEGLSPVTPILEPSTAGAAERPPGQLLAALVNSSSRLPSREAGETKLSSECRLVGSGVVDALCYI